MHLFKKVIAACIVVLALAFFWNMAPAEAPDAPPMQTASSPRTPIAAAKPVPATAPVRTAVTADTIEDAVKSVLASGTPEQHLEVFQKIGKCLEVEQEKSLMTGAKPKMVKNGEGYELDLGFQWADEKELAVMRQYCSTLSGRTRSDRLQLLQYALDRHVNGALAVYISEGPNGDRNALQERPTDPSVVDWRKATLKRLEEDMDAGYVDAIFFSLHAFVRLGKTDPEDFYFMFQVNNLVSGAINKGDHPFRDDLVQSYAVMLTEQQKNAADLHAQAVLQAWKRRNRKA